MPAQQGRDYTVKSDACEAFLIILVGLAKAFVGAAAPVLVTTH